MSNDGQRPGRDTATMIALFGLILVGGAILSLTAMVLPVFVFVPLIIFLFVLCIPLHYLVWGQWLSNRPRPDDDEE